MDFELKNYAKKGCNFVDLLQIIESRYRDYNWHNLLDEVEEECNCSDNKEVAEIIIVDYLYFHQILLFSLDFFI